ncbi:hypothetical protein NSQ62_09105 [Solibacillus sp. FSL H8-0523]
MVLRKNRINNAPEALAALIDIYKDIKLLDRIGDPMDVANLALSLALKRL